MSSALMPVPSAAAMMPPVLVPTTRSKCEMTGRPRSCSRPASSAALKMPRTPPPSRDRTWNLPLGDVGAASATMGDVDLLPDPCYILDDDIVDCNRGYQP